MGKSDGSECLACWIGRRSVIGASRVVARDPSVRERVEAVALHPLSVAGYWGRRGNRALAQGTSGPITWIESCMPCDS